MRSRLRRLGARTCAIGTLTCLLAAAATVIAQSPGATTWRELDRRAEELYVKGTLPEAIDAGRLALSAATTPAERGQSLMRLGALLQASGQSEEAEQHLRASLRIREDAFGSGSLEYAETAHELAVLARDTGRSDEAETLAARVVAIRRPLPANDVRLAQALDTYASVLGLSGKYEASIPFFEEAMAIHESIPPESRAMDDYGVLCVNLGGTYQRLGKYQLAETTMAKARAALRIRPGTQHLAYIASTLAFATLKADLAMFSEAESLFDEGIRLLSENYKSHPYYAAALNNRGVMYRALGNYQLAEKDLALSLELKAPFGRTSMNYAATQGNLGQILYRRDREAGERLLREAAATFAAVKEAPAYEHVNVLIGLARAERDRKASGDAEKTLQRALAATERLGLRHPLRAAVLRELGLTREVGGDLAGAEASLADALRIAEGAHGVAHPDLLPILRALARVHEARGDPAGALAIYRRSFEIEDTFLNDVFSIGSEAFKETVLASLTDPVHALIGFQSRQGDPLPEARALAFEAATRRKGRVLEHVRHRGEWLHRSPTEATAPVLDQLDAIARCRTSLMLALGDRTIIPSILGACSAEKTGVAGYERLLSDVRARWTEPAAAEAARAISVLQEREQTLEATLVRTLGPSELLRERVTVDTIAARLQDDEVLIELTAYLDDAQTGPNPAGAIKKYGAFVVTHQGRLSWVSLGEAAPIERAVADLLKSANDWTLSTRNREVQAARVAETTAADVLTEITRRVWRPLEAIVGRTPNVRRLRIAPDSALNLVPFDALGLAAGGVLIDRFSIAYLPAGRDLVRAPASAPHDPPVVVVSAGAAPGTTLVRRQQFPILPDAAGEARELAALLHAEVKTGSAASELAVKKVRSPLILHLAGHGRIGDDWCPGPPCQSPGGSTSAAMALSVMVFQEAYRAVDGSQEDGLLTAAELQRVDLRGTAMLVLSQCQMASGVPSVGEGIYGMRRAAAIAGAQTFVAPLWNVEDRVHRVLMREFYRGVVAGRDRATALREAQLKVKSSAPTHSFLYWAPVILSGEIMPLALPTAQ